MLGLDLFDEGTSPNIDHLLKHAHWPRLRVLRFHGVNCGAPELERFLTAHPSIEELGLAEMMPGDAWTQLEIPGEALPNLQHLDCSSPQAAALLKNSSTRPLKTLRYIEVHETLFHDPDEDHADEAPSPWKTLFVECLKVQNSITHLGVSSIETPEEMKLLAALAPQIKELTIATAHHLIWVCKSFPLCLLVMSNADISYPAGHGVGRIVLPIPCSRNHFGKCILPRAYFSFQRVNYRQNYCTERTDPGSCTFVYKVEIDSGRIQQEIF